MRYHERNKRFSGTAMSSLLSYQLCWLNDASRYKLGMFARQCGKTFTSTLEIVIDCVDAETRGEKRRWVILSRGERQAKEAMETGVQRHLRGLEIHYEERERDCEWAPEYLALDAILPGGSKITALPANPATARGFTANCLLDEFAFHQDSREIWKALFPVTSKPGLKLRVVSTPNGKGNKFHELMTAPELDSVWSRHVVDIYQAVAAGLPRDVEQLKSGLHDDDAWAQEYELQWLDEASAWLSYELIGLCETADAGEPSAYRGGPCFVGVDIGARRDLFVIWVFEAVGDVLWTRELIERQRIPFAEQDALLANVFKRYRVVKCCIDQTGMGEKPVEDAKTRHGPYRVEGVLFTLASKLEMATIAKERFEQRRVRIPTGKAIRDDLHKLQKTTTATGAPRFVAESDSDGHADRAWACFLALYAGHSSIDTFDYHAIPRRPTSKETDFYQAAASAFSRHGGIRGRL